MPSIGLVVFEGFQVMGMAALSAFEFANLTAGRPVYDVQILSERGGPVRSSLGFTVDTVPFGEAVADTTMTLGTLAVEPAPPAVLDYLRRASSGSRRIAGICTGAFVLAEAGLLDGRAATTHWAFARTLRERYPGVKVEEDRIFRVDGPVWT
ncbi:MAG TPA: AraC family transcriptional regulator, partial [Azospirillaceae bacterium]|nr:AraC family transcriptional regulator [Azospirillaceae bacterium]